MVKIYPDALMFPLYRYKCCCLFFLFRPKIMLVICLLDYACDVLMICYYVIYISEGLKSFKRYIFIYKKHNRFLQYKST